MTTTEVPLSAQGIALGLMMALSWVIIGWVWWVNRRYESPKWEKLLTFVITLFGAERFFSYGVAFVLMFEMSSMVVTIEERVGAPTSPFVSDLGMKLPTGSEDDPGVVSISQARLALKSDDSIWYEGRAVSLKEIETLFREESPNFLVIDISDREDFRSASAFVDLLNAATKAGIVNVTIAGFEPVSVPTATPAQALKSTLEHRTLITVKPDGSIWHDDRAITIAQFQEILVSEGGTAFRMKASQAVSTQRIKEIVQAAAEVGVNDVIFGGYPSEP